MKWVSFLLIVLLSACSSPNKFNFGLPVANEPSSGTSNNPSQSDNSDSSEIERNDNFDHGPNGAPSGEENPNALPPISIHVGSLKTNKLIAFSPDSQTTDVVIGSVGAVQQMRQAENDIEGALSNAGPSPIPNGTQVLVSVNEINVSNQTPDVQLSAPVGAALRGRPTLKNVANALIPSANAQEIVLPQPEIPNEICARIGNTCCDVRADGSFECTVQLRDSSVSQLYLAVIDPDGNRSPPVTEPIQKRLPFLGAPAAAIATGRDGSLYALTQNNVGVELQLENNTPRVIGNLAQNYQSFDPQGAEGLAFDGNELALRRTTQGIARLGTNAIALPGTTSSVGNLLGTVTVNGVQEYTTLKLASDGKLRFGVRNGALLAPGLIYRVDADPEQDSIQFVEAGAVATIRHRRTFAFDVDANNCALVVFEDAPGQADQAGNIRLRLGCKIVLPRETIEIRLGGTTPLDTNANRFVDIVSYKSNTQDVVGGRVRGRQATGNALLLDQDRNMVWLVDYLVNTLNPAGNRVTETLDENRNAIRVGTQPSAIALNTTRTRAYVTNQGDDTLSVIALDDPAGPRVINTIALKNFIQGNKEITIQPHRVVYQQGPEEMLLIGSASLPGVLIVPVNSL